MDRCIRFEKVPLNTKNLKKKTLKLDELNKRMDAVKKLVYNMENQVQQFFQKHQEKVVR